MSDADVTEQIAKLVATYHCLLPVFGEPYPSASDEADRKEAESEAREIAMKILTLVRSSNQMEDKFDNGGTEVRVSRNKYGIWLAIDTFDQDAGSVSTCLSLENAEKLEAMLRAAREATASTATP